MEIDIQIRNATPEDMQRMFGQQLATVITGGPAARPGDPEWLPQGTPRRAQEIEKTLIKVAGKDAVDAAMKAATEDLLLQRVKGTLKKGPGQTKKKGGDQDAPTWTDAEHRALDDNITDFNAAWKAYRKTAPHSTRTKSAVRQRWVIRARRKKNGGKIQKTPKTIVKRIDETSAPGSQQAGPQDPPGPDKQEGTKKEISPQGSDTQGEYAAGAAAQEQDPTHISPTMIATGMHVRQIKSEKGEKILGEALVLGIDGDQIKVRNGHKKARIVSASCLEVIPTKKKKEPQSVPGADADTLKRAGAFLTPAEEPILKEEDREPDEVNPEPPAEEVVKEPFQETPEMPETGAASVPPSPAPSGGLARGQKVRHNGAESDPHYGQIGTIERFPQQLSECLVSFKLSSSWVKKTDLVSVEASP